MISHCEYSGLGEPLKKTHRGSQGGEMEEDGWMQLGAGQPVGFFALSFKILSASSRSGLQKSVLEYEDKNHAHTIGDGAPCVLLGAGKRSNDTLPPVGGAQQSQVAVGGTEALLRRRRRPLGSSQHLRVLKQVGKIAGSGQVEVFSTVTSQGLPGRRTTPEVVQGWVNASSSLSSNSICVLKASLVLSPLFVCDYISSQHGGKKVF